MPEIKRKFTTTLQERLAVVVNFIQLVLRPRTTKLVDLLKKGLLLHTPGTAGRNVSYQVNWGWSRTGKV